MVAAAPQRDLARSVLRVLAVQRVAQPQRVDEWPPQPALVVNEVRPHRRCAETRRAVPAARAEPASGEQAGEAIAASSTRRRCEWRSRLLQPRIHPEVQDIGEQDHRRENAAGRPDASGQEERVTRAQRVGGQRCQAGPIRDQFHDEGT